MRVFVAFILSLSFSFSARAGVVVWLEDHVPDERIRSRANNRTGGTSHLSYWVLANPPAPITTADEEAYEALTKVIKDGKKHWNDFEVEFGIAQELEAAIDNITVIRSEKDKELLIAALMFQGAAIQVAFEPADFLDAERAEPFRYDRLGGAGNRPWSDAYALHPTRDPLPSDVADGATFPDLRSELAVTQDRPQGSIVLPPVQAGDAIFVDGDPLKTIPEDGVLKLAAGRHFLHVVHNRKVTGRRVFRVEEGDRLSLESVVALGDVQSASERVMEGTAVGFADSVKDGLEAIAQQYGGAVFVGAADGSKISVLPYAHGAAMVKQRRVTLVSVGEVGGGFSSTATFDGADGEPVVAPAVSGSLGLELGIYNLVIIGGVDMMMTPGYTVTHANGDENVDTSVFMQPYGGLGAYILRPTSRRATLLVAAHYSWLHPAYHSVGGRVAMGIPVDEAGGTWFRISVGGSGFPSSMWDQGTEKTPILQGFARLGLASRF